jgi:hypothetical protein
MYSGTDQDTDGIDDGLEMYLATRFFPNIHYSQGSNGGCLGPLSGIGINWPPVQKPVVFRAFHPMTNGGFAVPDYIYLAYVLLYDQDCGSSNPTGDYHYGDNESFIVVVRFNGADWEFVQVTTNPHRGQGWFFCEKSLSDYGHVYDHGDIWPGHNKHGNYPYPNSDACYGTDTAEAPFQHTTVLQHQLTNLGESVAPFVHDLGPLYNFAGIQPWAGIDPWNDRFLDAGYIFDDVLVHDYDFRYTPPPIGDSWHSTNSQTYCGFSNLGPLQLASQNATSQLTFVVAKSCAWVVRSDASWLTITSVDTPQYPYPRTALAGAGPGVVTFSIEANTSAFARSAHLFIGGLPVVVQQQGLACSFELSPPGQNFPGSGGSGSLALTVTASNCSWTATTSANWLAISSPGSGTGSSVVSLSIGSNPSSVGRSAQIYINGIAVADVTQSGLPCSFAVSPASLVLPRAASNGAISVTSSVGDCVWSSMALVPWLTITSAPSAGSGTVTFGAAGNTHQGARVGYLLLAGQAVPVRQLGDVTFPPDFDGDGRADLAVYRPSTGQWFIPTTPNGPSAMYPYGSWNDVPRPIDFDGDGRADIAVWRAALGNWYILTSSSGYTSQTIIGWGLPGDIPIPADFDGDGRTDLVVYRPSTGMWWVRYTANGTSTQLGPWGASTDIPRPIDYDGDGRADLAVWRPASGEWYIVPSSSGYTSPTVIQWGGAGDIPIPADFDGDGRTDLAVYRPSTGEWWVRYTANAGFARLAVWGLSTDIPRPIDFDGDGRADLAVWRATTGSWYILTSSSGYTSWIVVTDGLPGDIPAHPILSAPNPEGNVDIPSNGQQITRSAMRIAGWAIDYAATSGTGVPYLHAYIYVGGLAANNPVFVAGLTPVVNRPDVGAIFPPVAQFAPSGYDQTFAVPASVPAGTHDLVVFRYSDVAGDFSSEVRHITIVN